MKYSKSDEAVVRRRNIHCRLIDDISLKGIIMSTGGQNDSCYGKELENYMNQMQAAAASSSPPPLSQVCFHQVQFCVVHINPNASIHIFAVHYYLFIQMLSSSTTTAMPEVAAVNSAAQNDTSKDLNSFYFYEVRHTVG